MNEMIKEDSCFKNLGFTSNQVASMVIFIARGEVLGLSKAKDIWPKQLQLITRQTDRQVRKLASLFKKGIEREPFFAEELCDGFVKIDKSREIIYYTKQ